jgi:hypothetical protein
LYIPGPPPTENSWMGTDSKSTFGTNNINFNGEFAAETRGWWEVKNDFMGGPFYSLCFVHKKNGLLYTVEGFVYSPKFDKTPYLRELETIIHSIQFD